MISPLPPKFDFFAMFMFLGIVQGLFLAYFFISKKEANHLSNKFLGLILLSLALAITEIFLCYTNLMFHTLHLIDFAEPTNFLLAPLSYCYLQAKIYKDFDKKQFWHFAPFVFYVVYMWVIFYPQNINHKYNSYIHAYHPELPFLEDDMYLPYSWVFFFKDNVNELMVSQLLIYILLSLLMIFNTLKKENLSFWSKQNPTLAWCRRWLLQMVSIVVIFLVVKLNFKEDLGDHILAIHITLVIYSLSFHIVRQSMFFQSHTSAEEKESKKKSYEKSSLTPEIEENTLQKLQKLMSTEKPFLSSEFSMPALAKMLNISPHHLSQILNESLNQNFFEFAAQYRIEEAKKLLASREKAHLKIEEIAEMVGYNSKSAFNTSFKKLTGTTPSEFKKEKKE
jgi:AraC-like DNA-binding protein/NADH:ubiquinone oxidoreductase subunit 3 (subunit A)